VRLRRKFPAAPGPSRRIGRIASDAFNVRVAFSTGFPAVLPHYKKRADAIEPNFAAKILDHRGILSPDEGGIQQAPSNMALGPATPDFK
jgi:hypothetical protein